MKKMADQAKEKYDQMIAEAAKKNKEHIEKLEAEKEEAT